MGNCYTDQNSQNLYSHHDTLPSLRLKVTCFILKSNASGLEYSQAGVGGREGCRMQIVSDAGCTNPYDIRYHYLPIIP